MSKTTFSEFRKCGCPRYGSQRGALQICVTKGRTCETSWCTVQLLCSQELGYVINVHYWCNIVFRSLNSSAASRLTPKQYRTRLRGFKLYSNTILKSVGAIDFTLPLHTSVC